ncbi:lipoprotein-releasing ABC transporter permease subunit [Spiribacter sp. C176]|uniref:Lipoprotein-releasing ABC transporter permease subunit n=1 Tax=Spiribacter salilacus TaxID=2664894 RepID=A0A6N7QLA9_9GAMM|nr:lipoprotein-releasing ABC transporter permease subunit [Spiribacter salilacus]MRH77275.1 lipoprotein-releasing ABC transporter permease subunit [Spiribacter salilacus]
MIRPLPLFIGLRYTRARRRDGFVSFISASSMLGIAIGVMALITVLSVMNGFEKELRERILGMVSHATVNAYDGELNDWSGLVDTLQARPEVLGAAPFISGEAMLTRGGEVTGVLLRGVDPALEGRVSEITEQLIAGNINELRSGTYQIVIGSRLAQRLGVGVGDPLNVVTPEARVTAAGILPRLRRFEVAGIFEVDMAQYDSSVALIHLDDAQRLLRLRDGITGVRLEFADLMEAPRLVRDIALSLPGQYLVSDWTMQHQNFFRAVAMEKTVMFIILLLIVGVAAFNIVSTLVMAVQDKQSDIAILRTLGATPRTIMAIFIIQGSVLGVVGTLIGTAGGVALALNVETIVPAIEQLFNADFISGDVYYINDLPSDLRLHDVWRITLAAFGLSLLATLYPAWRASRIAPAEALRHE